MIQLTYNAEQIKNIILLFVQKNHPELEATLKDVQLTEKTEAIITLEKLEVRV